MTAFGVADPRVITTAPRSPPTAHRPPPTAPRNDGNERTCLDQPERRRCFHPDLLDVLRDIEDGPGVARLRAIEASGVVPGAVYFDADPSRGARDRAGFTTRRRPAAARPPR
jgi:hypothetical protein